MFDENHVTFGQPGYVPRKLKALLPFRDSPNLYGDNYVEWECVPQEPFLPSGLMIWNAPEMSTIEIILIGNRVELVAGIGPIPAKWFTTQDSYEQVWKAQLEGKEPAGWGDFHIIGVGMRVRIRMASHRSYPANKEKWEKVQLLMWGHSVR